MSQNLSFIVFFTVAKLLAVTVKYLFTQVFPCIVCEHTKVFVYDMKEHIADTTSVC